MRTIGVAVVRGRSMLPTLRDGDRLLVAYGRRPRVGSLALVRLPDRPLSVKRVTRLVAEPGQPEAWWVERDSTVEGVDSWLVGAIPAQDVLAVVLLRLWPRPGPLVPRRE